MVVDQGDIRQRRRGLLKLWNSGLDIALTIADPAKSILKLRNLRFSQHCRECPGAVEAGLVGAMIGKKARQIVGRNHVARLLGQNIFILRDRAVIIFLLLQDACQRHVQDDVVRLLLEAILNDLQRGILVVLAEIKIGKGAIGGNVLGLLLDGRGKALHGLIRSILRKLNGAQKNQSVGIFGICLQHGLQKSYRSIRLLGP